MRTTIILKSALITFLALHFSIGLFAQNWNPLPFGQTLLFQYHDSQNDRTGFMAAQCDSVIVEGQDTAFYLFRMDKAASNGQTIINCWNQTVGVSFWSGGDHFLGKKMLLGPDGDALFISSLGDTFLLRTFAGIGESWNLSDTITATVTAIAQEPVLGQMDSLKYISLSNGDSIILGKNSGLVQIKPIFETPSPLQAGKSMHLWGIPERGLGGTLPGLAEVLGFDVGDEFGSFSGYNSYPFGGYHVDLDNHFRVDSVISSGHNPSYRIWFEKTERVTGQQIEDREVYYFPQIGTIDFDSATYAQLDLLPYQYRYPGSWEYEYFLIQTGTYRWSLDTNRIVHHFDFGYVLDTCSGAYYYSDIVWGYAEFVSGIGLWEWKEYGVDWSQHNYITCFHTQEGDYENCPPFTVDSVPRIEGPAIYPVPAESELNVVFPEEKEARLVTLFSSDGTIVRVEPAGKGVEKIEIDVSGLRPGLYLLRIEANGRDPIVRRVMVAR